MLTLAPEEGLAREMALLEALSAGAETSGLLLWETSRCLVAPRRIERHPRFEAAGSGMASAGWPVVLRHSGGDIVPQGPGVINICHLFVTEPGQPRSIEAAYRRLCSPILEALAGLGVVGACAAVPGAFCNGSHNLVVGGRKLAGTAQRWRRVRSDGAGRFAVLAHAALLRAGDLVDMTEAVNGFYRLAGMPARVRAESHVTLAELLGPDAPDSLPESLRGAFERSV